MIEVSLSTMILLPLLFNLGLLLICYLYYTAVQMAQRARERRTRIYRCAICSHVYVDDRDVPLARCPRCGCLNEAIRR